MMICAQHVPRMPINLIKFRVYKQSAYKQRRIQYKQSVQGTIIANSRLKVPLTSTNIFTVRNRCKIFCSYSTINCVARVHFAFLISRKLGVTLPLQNFRRYKIIYRLHNSLPFTIIKFSLEITYLKLTFRRI